MPCFLGVWLCFGEKMKPPWGFRKWHGERAGLVQMCLDPLDRNLSLSSVLTRRGFHTFSGWWFGAFLICPYIGNNHPNWPIFFRGVENTNQFYWVGFRSQLHIPHLSRAGCWRKNMWQSSNILRMFRWSCARWMKNEMPQLGVPRKTSDDRLMSWENSVAAGCRVLWSNLTGKPNLECLDVPSTISTIVLGCFGNVSIWDCCIVPSKNMGLFGCSLYKSCFLLGRSYSV